MRHTTGPYASEPPESRPAPRIGPLTWAYASRGAANLEDSSHETTPLRQEVTEVLFDLGFVVLRVARVRVLPGKGVVAEYPAVISGEGSAEVGVGRECGGPRGPL